MRNFAQLIINVAHKISTILIDFIVVGIPTTVATKLLSSRPIIFSSHSKQLFII
jgi:hypothetical protein